MKLLLPTFVAAGLSIVCFGNPEPGTMEWFAGALKSANERESPPGVYIECIKREWPIDGGDAELEDLRHRVEGLPEHPDRREFERLAAQLEKNGFEWRYRIWFDSDRRWRVSIDTDDPMTVWPYMDTAMDRDGSVWRMQRGQLQLFEADAPPDRMDPASAIREVEWFANRFLTGGFFAASEPISSHFDGGRWVGVATNRDGTISWRFMGRVEEDAGLSGHGILLDTRTIIESGRPAAVGFETRFEDWQHHEEFGVVIPGAIEYRRGNGRITERWQLIEFRMLGSDVEIDELVSVPDPIGGSDPIRNLGDLSEIIDFRPGGGRIVAAVSGEHLGNVPRHRTGRRSSVPYWAGWTLAGLLVAALLWIRHRRN